MDINKISKYGGYVHANPEYNPKTKKGKLQPKYFVNADPNGAINRGSALADVMSQPGRQGYNLDYLGKPEKYAEYGVTINPIDDLNKELSEAQSGFNKLVHGIEQAVVSEIGIGTVKGISDLVDAIGQGIGVSDGDYTNPVSQYLAGLQKDFEEYTPIYYDQNKNINSGGLTDMGWWASNLPSIASSLTLLIPSAGAVKAVSLLGKLSKVQRFSNNAVKFMRGTKYLNKLTHVSPKNIDRFNRFVENGTTAALSRVMENYQEAQQVYDDVKNNVLNTFNNKDFTEQDYQEVIERNSDILEGVDINDKNAVADAIAHRSATRTFKEDFTNIGFDIIQLYALRNTWKGLRKAHGSASLDLANKRVIETAGKTAKEIEAIDASKTFLNKKLEQLAAITKGGYKTVFAESTEGIEEAVNYIAQQEGTHLGQYLLDGKDGKGLDSRLSQYVNAPQLWDSAFWGVLGGIVFQGLGSSFKRVQQKVEEGFSKKDTTVEDVKKKSWWKFDDLPEIKRRKSNIEYQGTRLNTLLREVEQINNGVNPYAQNNDNKTFDTETEEGKIQQELAREKAINDFADDVIMNSANNGNIDYLRTFLESDQVREALVNKGVISKEDAIARQQELVNRIDEIEGMYDAEVRQLNDIAAESDVSIPVEYLQIIANNNVRRNLAIQNYERIAQRLEDKVKYTEDLVKDKLGSNKPGAMNMYRQLVDLQSKAQELAVLYADKKRIETDKNLAKTLSGQIQLDNTKKKIKTLEQDLFNDTTAYELGASLFVRTISPRGVWNSDGTLSLDNTKESVEALDQILAGKFDDFLKEFGSTKKSSDFDLEQVRERIKVLTKDIERVTGKDNELDNINPTLKSTYQQLSAINTAVLYEQAQLTHTVNDVTHYANMLNNTMSEARANAIGTAIETIKEIADKYPNVTFSQVIDNVANQEKLRELIENLSVEDKNKFMEQLEILELTKDVNTELGVEIANILAKHQFKKIIDDAAEAEENGENSVTSQKPVSDDSQSEMDSKSAEEIKTKVEAEKPLNKEEKGKDTQGQEENQSNKPIDIDKFSLTPYTNDNPDAFVNRGNKSYKVVYDGEEVGELSLDEYDGANDSIKWVQLDEKYRNKGLGKALYKYLNKRANERNKVLYSDEFDIRPDAQRVWNSLKREGLAEDIPNPIGEHIGYRFKKNKTISSTGEQKSDLPTPPSNVKSISVEDIDSEIQKATVSFFKEHIASDTPITREDYNKYVNSIITRCNDEAFARILADDFFKDYYEVLKEDDDRNHLVKDVIMNSSSLSESSNAFTDAYKKVIDNLLKAYVKAAGISKVKGTYHISLEHLLKYCNSLSGKDTNSPAKLIFNQLRDYLVKEKPKGYEVYDLNEATDGDFLTKVSESVAARVEKAKADGMQRVGIRSYIDYLEDIGAPEEEINKVVEEIDKTNEGDKLTYDVGSRMITIKHNNIGIGSLLIPEVAGSKYSSLGISADALVGETGGWRWDLIPKGKTIDSRFGQNIISILDAKNDDAKEILNVLKELNNPNLTDSDKFEIVERLKSNQTWLNLRRNFSARKTSDVRCAQSLANIFTYGELANYISGPEASITAIDSFNQWLSYLNSSYEQARYLVDNPGTEIEVASKFKGEQNRVDADKARPINSKNTIADKYKGRVRIAVASNNEYHTLEASSSDEIQAKNNYDGVKPNSTFIIIPNANGNHTYVHAFPAKMSDSFVSSVMKSIKNEIHYTVLESIRSLYNVMKSNSNNQQDYINAIKQARETLIKLLDNNIDPRYGGQMNNPLLLGLRINRKNNFEINIFKPNGESLSIRVDNTAHTHFFYNGREYSLSTMTPEYVTDFIMGIIDRNTHINIGHEYIKSDNNSSVNLAGLATRTKDGKFQIQIGKYPPHVFDSFNDFIIDNNLVKVTTYVGSNGDNFKLVGDRSQLTNGTVHYKFSGQESNTTRPVEEIETKPTKPVTKGDRVIEFINNNDNFTGQQIAEMLLGERSTVLKELVDAGLLPEQVSFDKTVGDNAIVARKTGKVKLGLGFVEILNNGDYRQAVRKLVHERLHNLIETSGETEGIRKQIREIYDAFVRSNPGEELNQYINWNENDRYWDANNKTLTDEGIEEFFVESITSGELARYLNSVQSTTEAKYSEVKDENKTLWQKIVDILVKLLGRGNAKLNIKDNTLFAQEMLVLSGDLSNIANESSNEENKDNTQKTNGEQSGKKSRRVRYDTSSSMLGEKGVSNLDRYQNVTTRMDNLAIAKVMEQEGKTPNAIKLATGWEKGADGKWRYEILDLFLDSNVKKIISSVPWNETRTYKLKDLIYKGSNKTLANTAKAYLAIYPTLGDINVVFDNASPGGKLGSFNEFNNTLTINVMYDNSWIKNILAHELQHYIQKIEGFSKGSSPRTFMNKRLKKEYNDIKVKREALEKEINDLQKELNNISAPKKKEIANLFPERKYKSYDYIHVKSEIINALMNNDENQAKLEAKRGEYYDVKISQEVLDDIISKTVNINEKYKDKINSLKNSIETKKHELIKVYDNVSSYFDATPSDDDQIKYKRTAGEVEARTAEVRRNFTMEERRNSLFTDDMYKDVAKDDLIFIEKEFEEISSSTLKEHSISKSSVRSLVEKLPIDSQANMIKLINDGTINMSCK